MPEHVPPRIYRRVPFETTVRLEFDRFRGFVDEYSANLSLGGMFIRCTSPPPVGTVVPIEFRLEDGYELIRGSGRVVWARAAGPSAEHPSGFGIRFLELTPGSRELIFRLVERRVKEGNSVFELDEEREPAPSPAPAAEDGLIAPPWGHPGGARGEEEVPDRAFGRHVSELPGEQSIAASAATGPDPGAGEPPAPRDGAASPSPLAGVRSDAPDPPSPAASRATRFAGSATTRGSSAAEEPRPVAATKGAPAPDEPWSNPVEPPAAPAADAGGWVGEAGAEDDTVDVAPPAPAGDRARAPGAPPGMTDGRRAPEEADAGARDVAPEALTAEPATAPSRPAMDAGAWAPAEADAAPRDAPSWAAALDPASGPGSPFAVTAEEWAPEEGRAGARDAPPGGPGDPAAAPVTPFAMPAERWAPEEADAATPPRAVAARRSRRWWAAAAVAALVVVALAGGTLLRRGAAGGAEAGGEGTAAPTPGAPAAGAVVPVAAGLPAPAEETAALAPPAAPPVAEATGDGAGTRRELRAIDRITWSDGETASDFLIWGDGPIPPAAVDHFRLDDGLPRLVVRIHGVERPFQGERIEVGGPRVERIRTGFHPAAAGRPAALHVVFDLSAPGVRAGGVEESEGRLRVRFEGG